MQEQKLESQECKGKKKSYQAGKKCRECILWEQQPRTPNCRSNRFQRIFFKKEAYTPEYSPGYAAQEKTD